MKNNERHHYYFIKKILETDTGIADKADFEYKKRKQQLFIDDLKRFKLQAVYVDTYTEITSILQEIESIFKKRTVFISGSAEEYGNWNRDDAQQFIHKLSSTLIQENFRIVNGFGWGVGSAVINGALEKIYSKPEKYSEDQLIIKPFPQFPTGDKNLMELWQEYRNNMIEYSGVAIFLFGNKKDKSDPNKIIDADGVYKEFEIARSKKLFLIPVNYTGWMTSKISEELRKENYLLSGIDHPAYKKMELLFSETNPTKIIELIIDVIKTFNN
jgi:hypothetical protein